MPCSKLSINKNYKCDKAGCVCIPTGGKPCICVCENENGDFMRCDDCKCSDSDTCQCKCDDSKCTCIVTKGAACVCVCRDGRGNIKACDCSCIQTRDATCYKEELTFKSCECCNEEPEKLACGRSCKCDEKSNSEAKRRGATVFKNSKCDKAGCACIPTGGKPCICVCENENGDIMRCDDCTCNNSGTCKCKFDDSKCTCIVTKGAACVCVCRDSRGNIKSCDCSCIQTRDARCKKELTFKFCECCSEKPKKEVSGINCKCDRKRDFNESSRVVTVSRNYKCDKSGCVCLPTDGKTCICVCENKHGDIMRCDDCKCKNTCNCQSKCNDSKCSCVVTKRADCICVCRGGRGNFKACECSCVDSKSARCCYKDASVKPYGCSKKVEREASDKNCNCDGKWDLKESRHTETISKNYKCDKTGCICLSTCGKSCITACEDDIDAAKCAGCQCCSEKDCCKKQTCNNNEKLEKRNRGKYCRFDDSKGENKPNCSSPKTKEATCMCCGKYTSEIKTCVSNTKAIKFQGCTLKEKSYSCCNDKIEDDRKIDGQQGCVCISKETPYFRVADDGCVCDSKKSTQSCNCCY